MKTMQVLDRLVAVNLDVRIWSGRKKLTAEDLSLGADVPPEDLVSLGSKRVCDPESIKVFHRLKKQAERVCLTGGMRFLGGYAIPEDRTETVAAELDALGETFAQERATFVAGYGQAIEDWIALHPQWEAAIRKAVDPASVVESRLGFGYQLYRIAPAENAGNLAEQVEGLGDTLFGEVARIARELDKSFVGKDALSQRACPPSGASAKSSAVWPSSTTASSRSWTVWKTGSPGCRPRVRSPAPSSTRASA